MTLRSVRTGALYDCRRSGDGYVIRRDFAAETAYDRNLVFCATASDEEFKGVSEDQLSYLIKSTDHPRAKFHLALRYLRKNMNCDTKSRVLDLLSAASTELPQAAAELEKIKREDYAAELVAERDREHWQARQRLESWIYGLIFVIVVLLVLLFAH